MNNITIHRRSNVVLDKKYEMKKLQSQQNKNHIHLPSNSTYFNRFEIGWRSFGISAERKTFDALKQCAPCKPYMLTYSPPEIVTLNLENLADSILKSR